MTDNLMRFALIGQPTVNGNTVKILKLAAFAPAVPSAMDYNLRVYFVEATQDALEVSYTGCFVCMCVCVSVCVCVCVCKPDSAKLIWWFCFINMHTMVVCLVTSAS